MGELADILREAGRGYQRLQDGDYFDSSYFDCQATAVRKYIETLIEEAQGDTDYIKWSLKR